VSYSKEVAVWVAPDAGEPPPPEPDAAPRRRRRWPWLLLAGLVAAAVVVPVGVLHSTRARHETCARTSKLCPDTATVNISFGTATALIDTYLAEVSSPRPEQVRALIAADYRPAYDQSAAQEWGSVQWAERLGDLRTPPVWQKPHQWLVNVRRYGGPSIDTTSGPVSDRVYRFDLTPAPTGHGVLITAITLEDSTRPQLQKYPKITFARTAASYHAPRLAAAGHETAGLARVWARDDALYAHCRLMMPAAAGSSAGWWMHTRVGWVHGADLTPAGAKLGSLPLCDAHYATDSLAALAVR
jgi:hypothetical protein